MDRGACRAGSISSSVWACSELLIAVLTGIVEGIATMIVAVLLLIVLPTSPQRPRPLFFNGLIRFSDREQHILTARLGIDKTPSATHNARAGIPFSTVRKALLNYRRWPHFVSTACVFATWSPLTTYTPSIIMYAPPNPYPTQHINLQN